MNERETAALQVEDLTYNADGLIPCIVQDEQTREVLMMAWMNEEAVRRTISQGTTWFWSRSRQKFWHKGEEWAIHRSWLNFVTIVMPTPCLP